jgi:FMN-dependent oxidoreductase (nitrilotriacetate monooxygenase family)
MTQKMRLAFDLSYAHMEGRWRLPGSWTNRTYPDWDIFEEVAKIAERGCIDMIFSGDGTGIPATWRGSPDEAVRWGIGWPRQDLSPWFAAMSKVTQHVGFGLTYSSTFMHPFYVARLLNSLDHLTKGRIAFNVITSTRRADAANYGFDELMEHGSRYERMEEFIDVCRKLWDSVEPDAFVWDRETGMVAEPSKVHVINHVGKYFKVRGPLNTPPSPQGHPVLIQAGGSPRGIKASAYVADHVFAAGKPLKQKVQHRRDLDQALLAQGRDPASVGMIFEVVAIVAETEQEAKAHAATILNAIPREGVGAFVSHQIGYDCSKLPARFTPGEINRQIAATGASPVGMVHQLALEVGEGTEITRDDFFEFGRKYATGLDHTVAGSAAQIADFLEEEFEATGCRGGFMLAHPIATPRDFLNIVDYLIPELQRRGRFKTRYEGKTLRENLALK